MARGLIWLSRLSPLASHLLDPPPTHQEPLPCGGLSPKQCQNLAGDVAGIRVRCEKHERRRDLLRLRGRPYGVSAPNSRTSFAGFETGLSGVHTGPGATQFTRIFLSTSI